MLTLTSLLKPTDILCLMKKLDIDVNPPAFHVHVLT